jgi:hypothetical protein
MTINNQYELEQEAKEIAKMAMIEKREYGMDPSDYIHQACDGHECVIYTYKAGLLCLECDREDGEAFLEDMYGYKFTNYTDHVTKLAYAILAVASMNAFYDLIESKAA